MFYLDTSILVAYYCPEALSKTVEAFLAAHDDLAVSPLVELELSSAVARKVRERGLESKDGTRIVSKFLSHLRNGFYASIPLETHHFRLARDWIGQFKTPLRTFDALHLAVSSGEGATLVTSDRGLLKSAKTFSVDALLLGP